MKQTRTTGRKRAILEFLESLDEAAFARFGAPPYNARTIASAIDADGHAERRAWDCLFPKIADSIYQSVARTCRSMEKDGLLVPERAKQPVMFAVSGRALDVPLACYYSAASVEKDRIAGRHGTQARLRASSRHRITSTPSS